MKNEQKSNKKQQSTAELTQIRTAISHRCFDLDGLIIFGIDTNGKIILANNKACHVFGYSEKDLAGKHWADYLAFESEKAYFNRLLRRYQTDTITDRIINRTGINANNKKLKYIEYELVLVKEEAIADTFLLSGKDITDFMNVQNELLLSVNRYRMLATNIPGINMYLFDTEMRFIIAEGSEMKNHGLTPMYFEGKTLQDLEDSSIHELMEPLFISALDGREISTELIFGNEIYAVSVLPLYNSEGMVYGGMSLSRNITKQKENAERLSKARKEAEEANKAKSEFLANISHEIRTPLSAIVGFSEQLLKMELNDKQRSLAEIIEQSSEQLLALVNDLLILSKIEAGKIDFDENVFIIGDVVKYVIKSLKSRADERKIGCSYTLGPGLDRPVVGDEFRLSQILTNLVSNAIKFTHQGSVHLTCHKVSEDNDQLTIQFEISDTGVGIPEDKLKVIFEQFRQADSAVTKKYGGTGLGLSISKRLVELQNGSIKVESKVGEGTRFTVLISYIKGQANGVEKPNFLEHKIQFDGLRVLVVDDDSMIRLLSHTILVNFGCDVALASDGDEAIDLLKSNSFDVVLLDINMPGISGIHVAEFLRQEMNDTKTKIVAVTAALMKRDMKKYKAAGMDLFLTKPFREVSLYNILCKALGYSKQQARKKKKVTTLPDESGNQNLLDITDLKEMAQNDGEFIYQMLETFTQNVIEGLDKIQWGVHTGDWKQVGETAHKLIPSFMHLKIREAIPLLKKLETITIYKLNTEMVPETVNKLIILSGGVLEAVEKEKDFILRKG